ncbi:MAG: dephospho-CoA kinase [Rickettsiales bacterium]|nr:dephospho-CoA kinase [Rickettsiales bacterium]
MLLTYGLTGNIACGKSAVESILREQGIPVIDADQVARDVVAPGQPTLTLISERFGQQILCQDGSLDRGKLGALVFADPSARKDLEAITHPAIISETLQRLQQLEQKGECLAVVSAALMVESGSYRAYAGLLLVTCDVEQQLQRLMTRDGLSQQAASARIDSQMDPASKAELADRTFDNSGPIGALEPQVLSWLAEALATAHQS